MQKCSANTANSIKCDADAKKLEIQKHKSSTETQKVHLKHAANIEITGIYKSAVYNTDYNVSKGQLKVMDTADTH